MKMSRPIFLAVKSISICAMLFATFNITLTLVDTDSVFTISKAY